MARTGSSAYIQYGYESSFKGGATQAQVFGLEQKATGLRWLNNQIALGQLYSTERKIFAYAKNEGSVNLEWVVSNPWYFDYIFANPETTGAGPYTHKWSSDPDFVGAGAFDNTDVRATRSGHIEMGFEGETGNEVRNAKGVICPTLTMRTNVNDTIKCTGNFIWGREDNLVTTLDTSVASDDLNFPYTFVHASLELPDGTVIAQIQDFELTFAPNVELIWGIGSADAAASSGKKIIDMTGRFKKAKVDKSALEKVRNRSEEATLEIIITNGLSGTNEKSITLLGTGVGISEHDNDVVPGEVIFENLQWQIRSMLVTAVNNISSPPT
ncbi:MAG: hypothetical protein GWN01_01330 [Nitrosopumilaceae archaeon]|nr:hypothetical protein [Nitrosopumilaceae archaeon]NIU86001.1 hypothetical protein [Nitrosopumilaceae archaeon]NIX60220.1 hypothetical protein [Nitrosopumilaceae archaeon]